MHMAKATTRILLSHTCIWQHQEPRLAWHFLLAILFRRLQSLATGCLRNSVHHPFAMSDMHLAAAYAAGGEPPPAAFAQQQQQQRPGPPPPRRQPPQQQYRVDAEMGVLGELPNIDDLEVAAAAAGVAPVPAVLAEMGYFELGRQPEAEQISSSDDEDGSSDEGTGWGGAAGGVLLAGEGCWSRSPCQPPAVSRQPPRAVLCCCPGAASADFTAWLTALDPLLDNLLATSLLQAAAAAAMRSLMAAWAPPPRLLRPQLCGWSCWL
jgi:hypothetical protein